MTVWYVFAGVLTFLYILRCAVTSDFLRTVINFAAGAIGVVIGAVYAVNSMQAWFLVAYFVARIVFMLCWRSSEKQGMRRTPENFDQVERSIGALKRIAELMLGIVWGFALSWMIREALLQPPIEVGSRPGMLVLFSMIAFNAVTSAMVEQWTDCHKGAITYAMQCAFAWFMLAAVSLLIDVAVHLTSADWV